MLRRDATIQDLLILTIDSPQHWETMQMLFSRRDELGFETECQYLVQLAFELLDKAVAAPKLSHTASFWWQVMNRMRDGSVYRDSPNQTMSKHVHSYLFQLLSGRLFSWARESLEKEEEAAVANRVETSVVPGYKIDFATVGTDVNTFVGFSLFSLRKKYGIIEELAKGFEEEDKFWLLTDLVATEGEIANNKEYVKLYYDAYYMVLNRGDMTLVSPRYADLFHKILYKIVCCLNVKKVIEDNDECMNIARTEVNRNLPYWAAELKRLAEGVYLVDPDKACTELLDEIVKKIFNSRGNAVLKRYYSMYLARGGKAASQSSQRESRKHEGLGRANKKQKTDTIPPAASLPL